MHRLSQITPRLYLSSYKISKDKSLLEKNGITHVINLSQEPDPHPETFHYLSFIIDDVPSANISYYFPYIWEYINEALNEGGKVLINCWAGISRASTSLISYLITHRNMELRDALKFVRSKRYVVDPNSGFIRQLRKLRPGYKY